MTRSNSTILALLFAVLAGAALAAWLLVGAEGEAAEQTRGEGTHEAVEDEPAPVRVEAPLSADPGEAQRREREPATSTLASAPPRIVLTGFVRTANGPASNVDLIVAAATGTPVKGADGVRVSDVTRRRPSQRSFAGGAVCRSGADGAYRIDVTKFVAPRLLDARGRAVSQLALWVKAVRIGENPREFELSFPAPAQWLTATAPIELRADIELRSSCALRGSVIASTPIQGDANVALFEWVDGAPVGLTAQIARCDTTSGEFELPVDCPFDGVLLAWSEGLRPQSRRVTVDSTGQRVDLVLERGASIAGRVSVAEVAVQGEVHFQLVAPNAVRCALGETWISWTGSSFEWWRLSVSSDERGQFEAAGLAPAEYVVSVGSARGVYGSQMPSRTLSAPASGVELSFELARVELAVFKAGQPAPRVRLEIYEENGGGAQMGGTITDDAGLAVVWLAPDSQASVWESNSGGARKIAIDNPGPGRALRVRIDL